MFKKAWPGIMRTVYRNHERFENTYFKKFTGFYVTGDGKTNTITSNSVSQLCVFALEIGGNQVQGAIKTFLRSYNFCLSQVAGGIKTATTGSPEE